MSHFISFTVVGTPVGKGRPRVSTRSGFVRTYTPAKTREYEAHVADTAWRAMRDKGLEPTIDAVEVYIAAFYPIPRSFSKKKRLEALMDVVRPTVKPDCDNVCKAILDAMNGVVYLDDKQVVDCRIKKHYVDDGTGHVSVHVSVI